MPIEIESPEELGYSAIANNLSESSCADMRLADFGIDGSVGDLLLQYGDHRGSPQLREILAADGNGVMPDDVIVTAGAAAALFMVSTCLLGNGGHAVIAAPNYATNLETPRSLGADISTLDLRFEDGWTLDPERIEAALTPETWLVSLTYPHNPTGAMIDEAGLRRAVEIVEAHPTARLLVDETYRELAYGEPLPLAASLSDRAISVSSLSKTYGLPGLRIGWVISRDAELSETLLAAKEQILICGSAIDEEMAARVAQARLRLLPAIRTKIEQHLGIVREWIAGQEIFEWVEPQAGVVGMPRFREDVEVDIDAFYKSLLDDHGTYVGPGHWFDQDRRAFRLGFAWPEAGELKRGLAGLLAAADGASAQKVA